MSTEPEILYDAAHPLDPIGDADRLREAGVKKNYARVGSSRPSSLLYTYGPGAIMDLPHFTVMPGGYDDWDRIWARRDGAPTISAPALLDVVQLLLGHQVTELRRFPHQAKETSFSREGSDLGVPARVFPQWLRCTGCDLLARIDAFDYRNTSTFRPDEAIFEHTPCHGRRDRRDSSRAGSGNGGGTGRDDTSGAGKSQKARRQPAVTARYLLACANGHLDEFPYSWWVHEGAECPGGVENPRLAMIDRTSSRGATATIICRACNATRGMNEAQGEAGRSKLPRCRGRLPHLDGFEPGGCQQQPRLMLVGASNLWFPAVQSTIVMPRLNPADRLRDDANLIRVALGAKLAKYHDNLEMVRDLLDGKVAVTDLTDSELAARVEHALAPPESEEQRQQRRADWEPLDLVVPEWRYLLLDPAGPHHEDKASGLVLSPRERAPELPAQICRVLAVDALRKVNALVGFTRIDEFDRINDLDTRVVQLDRRNRPSWVVATEDRGEGIFLQLYEPTVAAWEARVLESPLWEAHRAAHERNFLRRFSETAKQVDPDSRLRPPRYWLVHTLAHLIIRQLALSSGYGAASISERIYAWHERTPDRPAAAGVLLCTTASDSDGTLGGLVRLSEPDLLAGVVRTALRHAGRCSSDPVCSTRTPHDPEDFLHGAACHCCAMASETTCERANRFLDRRFLLSLPGSDLGFFGAPQQW